MNSTATLLPLLLLLHVNPEALAECHPGCSCKWKNGKQTVNCIDKSMSDIPQGLDPETQVLDFAGNTLLTLPGSLFASKHLTNLQRIYLPRCRIKNVSGETFKGLTNLVELDLSHNSLQSVPSVAFAECVSLMRLSLSHNPIKRLKDLAFDRLAFLNNLELSGCLIRDVSDEAFQGLHSLEWLHLNDNRLTTIRSLPQYLKGVELRGNPWRCDCHIRELHAWLRSFHVPVSVEPTCAQPESLKERTLRSVPAEELACLPEISPTTFYLELSEGKNVSLKCHVHAVPAAEVSWIFSGRVLRNNSSPVTGLNLIYFLDETGEENKHSELSIYDVTAEDNGTFVCLAKNAAGTSQSNFTIRIIIKEEDADQIVVVTFPVEYLLTAVVLVSVLVLGIVFTVAIICVKRRKRRKRAAKSNKAKITLQQQNLKTLVAEREEQISSSDRSVVVETAPEERNPDLLSEVHRRDVRDVEWVDSEGYPMDYGLPKPIVRQNYYSTLPHSRRGKMSEVSVKLQARPSLEAYDDQYLYHDVRYTAAGYPVQCLPSNFHHHYHHHHLVDIPVVGTIVGFNADPHIAPVNKRCASAQTDDDDGDEDATASAELEGAAGLVSGTNRIIPGNESITEALTESPDEGYEGEPSVVV